MIITLSGMPGAGKDTVANILHKKLGYRVVRIGEIRRKLAEEHGLTLEELNRLGEQEFWTDKEVDAYQEELGATMDNFILVSRLGWRFIPQSFKVFLMVDPSIGAERIYLANRPSESFSSLEEAYEHVQARIASDERRYAKYYQLTLYDVRQYDLSIDTTRLTPEDVAGIILTALTPFRNGEDKQ